MATDTYHHGNLREALLRTAVAAIAESGAGALSLRELARRAGVSHAAPAHHFRDKAGLLTAVAAEGYELLAESLRRAAERTGSFVEVGVAYVRFAIERRGHFEVMFRPDQLHADDPGLTQARAQARDVLRRGLADLVGSRAGDDPDAAALAAWALVHGFADLWLSGSLPEALGDDPEPAARSVARVLFQ
ncbi:MAG: TetR/AcrR family transcriptional regulator [Dehalococcoidia bacterium]